MVLTFLVWIILMFIGIPISFSLIIAISGYFLVSGELLIAIPHRMMAGSSNFTTLAIPFFILAAAVINEGGITNRIFHFCRSWVGHLRGSLGHVNILASVIFAGKSGSGAADVAGLGPIEMEAQRQAGFDDDVNVGVTLASATIGPIIPPSIPLVLYGSLAGVSVGALFLGGYFPGILMAGTLFLLVYIYARKRNFPVFPKTTLKERIIATRDTIWALLAPPLLMLGIFLGVMTPTEAAAVAIVYSLIISIFIYRGFKLKDFFTIVLDTVETTGTIIMLMAAAGLFGWTLSRAQVPQTLAVWLLGVSSSPLVILLLMNLFLLMMGCFIEGLAALVILVPIILPILAVTGIDPVHFGVVMVVNITIGAITPPVGTYLFIMVNVAKLSLEKIYKSIIPWLIPLLVVLLLITAFPGIILFLPRLFGFVE